MKVALLGRSICHQLHTNQMLFHTGSAQVAHTILKLIFHYRGYLTGE